MPARHIYNLKRSVVDPRLHVDFHERLQSQNKPLPAFVDLRSKMPKIFQQGDLGSCTAMAGCAAVQYLDPTFSPSQLFLYYKERQADGDVDQDSGSSLSQCVATLKAGGVCTEALWPYNIKRFADLPPKDCSVDAAIHKVLASEAVAQTLPSMRACLAQGHPFLIGIDVYESFESEVVAKTGVVPIPNVKTERLLGGHALVVVGYTEAGNWIVRNSWGSDWGCKGYLYLPGPYLTDTNLSSDFHAITKINVPKAN
jgi:C1A family cysteine protease